MFFTLHATAGAVLLQTSLSAIFRKIKYNMLYFSRYIILAKVRYDFNWRNRIKGRQGHWQSHQQNSAIDVIVVTFDDFLGVILMFLESVLVGKRWVYPVVFINAYIEFLRLKCAFKVIQGNDAK